MTLAILLDVVGREGWQHRVFHVLAIERSLVERMHGPVDAQRRRGAGDEEQIAAASSHERAEPGFQPGRSLPRRCVCGDGVVQGLDEAVDVLLHASEIIRDSPAKRCRLPGLRPEGAGSHHSRVLMVVGAGRIPRIAVRRD